MYSTFTHRKLGAIYLSLGLVNLLKPGYGFYLELKPFHEAEEIIFEPPDPQRFDYETKMFSAWKQKHKNDNQIVIQLWKKMSLVRTSLRLQGQKKVKGNLEWNKSQWIFPFFFPHGPHTTPNLPYIHTLLKYLNHRKLFLPLLSLQVSIALWSIWFLILKIMEHRHINEFL